MKKLREIFILPFIMALTIILLVKIHFRYKKGEDMQNVLIGLKQDTIDLLDKYHAHIMPFSALFWIALFLTII